MYVVNSHINDFLSNGNIKWQQDGCKICFVHWLPLWSKTKLILSSFLRSFAEVVLSWGEWMRKGGCLAIRWLFWIILFFLEEERYEVLHTLFPSTSQSIILADCIRLPWLQDGSSGHLQRGRAGLSPGGGAHRVPDGLRLHPSAYILRSQGQQLHQGDFHFWLCDQRTHVARSLREPDSRGSTVKVKKGTFYFSCIRVLHFQGSRCWRRSLLPLRSSSKHSSCILQWDQVEGWGGRS